MSPASQPLRSAFETVTGVGVRHDVDVTGKTELAIFAETAKAHGIDADDDPIRRYRDELGRQYELHADALLERGRALPGAARALAGLADVPGLVQSVLTGNLRSVARTKLRVFNLDQHIDWAVGAYGDDEHDRHRLVPIAQQRANQRYKADFQRLNTVIVGDSTSDVSAALTGGAVVIAVASGRDNETTLRQAGAHAVLPNLTDFDIAKSAILTAATDATTTRD